MGWTPPPDSGINVPEWKCHRPLKPEGASTMQITTVGIDLAKNVSGDPVLRVVSPTGRIVSTYFIGGHDGKRESAAA